MNRLIARWLGLALIMILTRSLVAQHYHLNVGAQSQSPGTPLYFQNAGSFGTNSNFVLPLQLATSGVHAGRYIITSLSPTAIGSGFFTPPAPGTQARLRFLAVSGPADASFGVWDVSGFNEEEESATSITFSVPVGTTNGTQSILLSQNNGELDADPFGHIHGRAFSATKPGLYVVVVQAYDASANGPLGGPIHTNSEALPIFFQAGITIAGIVRNNSDTTLTFATALGKTYYVQSTTNLMSPASWQDIAGPLTGDNRLEVVMHPEANSTHGFYRLRVTTP